MNRELQTDPKGLAWHAFLRELPALYEKYPEQWAAYRGEELVAIHRDDWQLRRQCQDRGMSHDELFVFGIVPVEPEWMCGPMRAD